MNKKITYLYIDDKLDTAIGIKDNLEGDNLTINVIRESPWADILDYLFTNESNFDGLILDWKLDGEDDSEADFSTEALAQQCRRLQVETVNGRKFSKSFPIILCSSQPDFSNIYEKDTTGEDLFDRVFDKSDLEDKEDFLLSLNFAYKFLSQEKNDINKILSLSKNDILKIDQSLIKKISEIKDKQPHETVNFLLNEVINTNGALINEAVLAARLGVNTNSDGWNELKMKIEIFKYKGILCDENKWWSDLINDWWSNEFEGSILKFISAPERIIYLEQKFSDLKSRLDEPDLCDGADSKEFWTVCLGTNNPISEMDGFITDKHLHYSWQEKEYICLDEAKDETHRGSKWKSLLPYEEERLKLYFDD